MVFLGLIWSIERDIDSTQFIHNYPSRWCWSIYENFITTQPEYCDKTECGGEWKLHRDKCSFPQINRDIHRIFGMMNLLFGCLSNGGSIWNGHQINHVHIFIHGAHDISFHTLMPLIPPLCDTFCEYYF